MKFTGPGSNLGADQIGELYKMVHLNLVEGETFNLGEVSTKTPGMEKLWILGSRGTTMLATLDDKGWHLRRMP